MAKLPNWIGVSVAVLTVVSAEAALQANGNRGTQVMQIPVAGRPSEVCVIPKHLPDADFDDKDGKEEKNLCGYDIHTTTAVCPKLNSTNPGLDFYEIPTGATKEQFEASRCKTPKSHMVAKYKLSTSCSYTPSILAYYHMSRILGGVAEVPQSVIRTVDIHTHIQLGEKALAESKPTDLIHQNWNTLMGVLTAGINSPRRDLILTDDFQQSYGALSSKPKHEVFYHEFFNGGADNVARAANFKNGPIMALQARRDDVANFVGRAFTAANVQHMLQMKDASEMVILDTLLSQQDRFGNVHEVNTFMYLDQTGKLQDDDKLAPADVTKLGAVSVKKMMLKDNDCGVNKVNIAAQAGLLAGIGHLDPNTYQRLLKLNAEADQAAVQNYFKQELLFTPADYARFRTNLKTMSSTLYNGCKAGTVRLDLDLNAHFSKAAIKPVSCEI